MPNPSRNDYDDFVDDFWIYDPTKHGNMPELGYVALAIAGEAGELAEKIKKIYREKDGRVDDPAAIMKELGDILYYVTKMSHMVGFGSIDVAEQNVKKLNDRRARGKMHGSGDNR